MLGTPPAFVLSQDQTLKLYIRVFVLTLRLSLAFSLVLLKVCFLEHLINEFLSLRCLTIFHDISYTVQFSMSTSPYFSFSGSLPHFQAFVSLSGDSFYILPPTLFSVKHFFQLFSSHLVLCSERRWIFILSQPLHNVNY